MKSISGKNWEEIKVEKRLVDKIKIDYNLNTIQAKLVISRNFNEEELLSIRNNISFTNPFIKSDDFLMGYKLLEEHISRKNKILIIGDYDVDGCLSASLMFNFLKKLEADVNYFVPDRFKDGYGASKNLIKELTAKFKPQLIIFLDCGSSSFEAIEFINSKKISSLIIDHHNIVKPYPLSQVIINPKKGNGYNKYDYLCTVFLTYLFIDLYIKKKNLEISFKENQIYSFMSMFNHKCFRITIAVKCIYYSQTFCGSNRYLCFNMLHKVLEGPVPEKGGDAIHLNSKIQF